MRLKPGALTQAQQRFCEAFAVTGDVAAAERKAGLRPRVGYTVLQNATAQQRIAELTDSRLLELAPIALKALHFNLTSDKVPAATRQRALEYTLDKVREVTGGQGAAALEQMTPEQLQASIAAIQQQIDKTNAQLIDVTPSSEGVFE